MSRFIKLTLADGAPIVINIHWIVAFHTNKEFTLIRLNRGSHYDLNYYVKEAVEEISDLCIR